MCDLERVCIAWSFQGQSGERLALRQMRVTVGGEGHGGWFGAEQVRTRRLPLAAIFIIIFCCLPLELKFP